VHDRLGTLKEFRRAGESSSLQDKRAIIVQGLSISFIDDMIKIFPDLGRGTRYDTPRFSTRYIRANF